MGVECSEARRSINNAATRIAHDAVKIHGDIQPRDVMIYIDTAAIPCKGISANVYIIHTACKIILQRHGNAAGISGNDITHDAGRMELACDTGRIGSSDTRDLIIEDRRVAEKSCDAV